MTHAADTVTGRDSAGRSIYPSLAAFCELAATARAVPVTTELLLDDETPVSAFRKLHLGGPAFLLESMEGGERWGRYSMLASGARTLVTVRGQQVVIEESGPSRVIDTGDPLGVIQELLDRSRPAELPGVPRFAGGAVGYLGYDVVRRFERLPDANPDPLDLPDARLMIADTTVVFDNLRHTVRVIHNAQVGDEPAADYARAVGAVERTVALLAGPRRPAAPGGAGAAAAPGAFVSAMGQVEYERAAGEIVEAIHAGEAIQVVLSHRLSRAYGADPFDTYRALRVINPSPYMFFLDLGDVHVAGASPEVLVRVEGDAVSVRPIAGTRRRGEDAAADQALEEELRRDKKERAEHLMLVDLGRNDLGRVARFGSVSVDDFMVVERYSHVMHLVSEVHGRLREGCTCMDALRAAFPAGTVSGAPKVRAMQLIDQLEPHRRGVYAGAVGYFDYQGNMDTCIAIRTLVFKDGVVHVQAGAGIVADSVPAREWEETLHKATALFRAVDMADRRLELPAPGESA